MSVRVQDVGAMTLAAGDQALVLEPPQSLANSRARHPEVIAQLGLRGPPVTRGPGVRFDLVLEEPRQLEVEGHRRAAIDRVVRQRGEPRWPFGDARRWHPVRTGLH